MVKLTKQIGYVALRLTAFCATLVAVVIMVTTHDRASFFALSVEAKYSQMPAFKYFVIANAVVSVYSFLVLFLPKESLLWKFAVVMDLVMTMLLTSSISAALAVAEVGKRGNAYAGWLPVCGQLPKFCDHITAALVAGFVALLLYIFLLLFSLHSVLDPFLLQKS